MEPTQWKFYRFSHQAWEGIIAACENAERSIDFQQYYFIDLAPSLIGRRFVEVLRRKSRQGVRVRLLLDATGSWEFYRSNLVAALREDGIQIEFHKTIPRKYAGRFFQSFLRDHRRLLVIDDILAMVGGIVIKEEARDWRETHVELRGLVVGSLCKTFEFAWNNVGAKGRFKVTKPEVTLDQFTVLPNGPRLRSRYISRYIIDAVRQAEKSIYITTPYFIPDHKFFHALRLAALRGVDVRLLVPTRSDVRFAETVMASFFDGAIRSGIRIYRYTPSFLHAKTLIIDDDWGTVGSCNLDRLSLHYNYELNVLSYDRKFVLELKDHFFDDLQSAFEVTKEEWSKRSIVFKIMEKFAIILRPFA